MAHPHRRCVFPLLLLTAVVPLIATPAPQNPSLPTRDAVRNAPVPTGTGRISGQVMAADTGAAVRRARVTLSGTTLPPATAGAPAVPADQGGMARGAGPMSRVQMEAEVDRSGRYEFTGLPAGRYMLSASAQSGYVPNTRVEPVELRDGEARTLSFRLDRTGVIVGRILDEYGDPVVRASVRAARRNPYGGPPSMTASGTTDDLGQFRLFDLRPGNYDVTAIGQNMPTSGMAQNAGPRAGYLPTYYPGVPSPAQAQAIAVKAAQESHAIFALSRGTLGCVRGTVLDSTGGLVTAGPNGGGGSVMLVPRVQEGGSYATRGAGIQPNGTFTLCDAAPGDYYLMANLFRPQPSGAASGNEAGFVTVTVNGDEGRADVQTNLGATISGRVVIEGSAPASPRPPGQPLAMVNVRSAGMYGYSQIFSSGRPGTVRDDGSFEITGVRGQILLSASGAGAGAALKAILRGADDITTTPMDLVGTERIDDVTVVLTRDTGRLEGLVTNRAGEPAPDATVIVFSDDPGRQTYGSPFTRTTRSLSAAMAAVSAAAPPAAVPGNPAASTMPRTPGGYSMAALVPGRYLVVALDTGADGMPTPDAAFFEKVHTQAVSVTIAAGATAKLNVTLSKIGVGTD